MRLVYFKDLGTKKYREVWEYQESLLDSIINIKRQNRNSESKQPTKNYLLFVEHYPVYTLGKSGDNSNLLIDKSRMKLLKAEYYHINRGGDITFHGPGQLVVYPIFDLENFFTDIHKYLRTLENIVIEVLNEYSIKANSSKGETGVWLDVDTAIARKICAMGVRASRWVTMHGLALNVNTDLSYFDYIIPCGIQGKNVTSIQKELNRPINMMEVKNKMKKSFQKNFSFSFV